jgi:hypothetical protein
VDRSEAAVLISMCYGFWVQLLKPLKLDSDLYDRHALEQIYISNCNGFAVVFSAAAEDDAPHR